MAKPKNKKKITIESDKDINEAATSASADNLNGQEQTATADNADESVQKDTEQNMQEALANEKDKYLRLAAEYDNFRKRSAKERETTYANAKADVINRLLPVYDNLQRAIKMECSDEAYYKGIEMTMQQLTEILKDMGVSPMPTVGEPFDPNRHEAVAKIDNPDIGSGIIADECQTGFIMGDRVIRHSKVVVAN